MLLLVAGIVAYAVISNNKPAKKTATNTRTTAATPTNNNQQQLQIQTNGNTAQPTSGGTQTLGVSNEQGGSFGLQSNLGQSSAGSSTNNSSNAAPTLPGPETFGTYEQYKDGQNALYAEVQVGTGQEVGNGTTVAMLYKGWLTNGTLFDQSRLNEEDLLMPFVFELGSGKVIPGWDQGIAGMKVGGKRRLIIPPAVGYGAKGQGSIPPNAVLVFDVELVDAQQKQSE